MWKPAALFSRLATARPMPAAAGHWAQMWDTPVPSNQRRASKTRRACSGTSVLGPSCSSGWPANSPAYSSKQITPSPGAMWAWM